MSSRSNEPHYPTWTGPEADAALAIKKVFSYAVQSRLEVQYNSRRYVQPKRKLADRC
jgi:hypothetical protein